MSATILHGENHTASRQKLNSLIDDYNEKDWEVIKLDAPNSKELLDALLSQSLFATQKVVVSENFLSTNKDGMATLQKVPVDAPLVLWERKTLTPTQVKNLQPRAVAQEFKLPSVLFALIDNIFPANAEKCLGLFINSRDSLETELVFAMIARQLRLLLWAKLEPESLSLPAWQKAKLQSQSDKFTPEQMFSLHTKLLEIDREHKMSQLPENLSSSLELLFASL